MMSALQAGGMELVCDGLRPADAHNPRGYFEDRRVRRLAEDSRWLLQEGGRAVKIIYRLLYHLPRQMPARVLLMQRPLDEVVASQQAMLASPDSSGLDWISLFESELRQLRGWLAEQQQITVLEVSFARLLADPGPTLAEVISFLQRPLQAEAMAAVVEPSLRHQG